jgi:hypothetical protein
VRDVIHDLIAEAAGDVRDDVVADEWAGYCLLALTAASPDAVGRLVAVTLTGLRRASRAPSARRHTEQSLVPAQVHDRICPSAVSRARSQAPQNGRVTVPMTPTRAPPWPATSRVSAGLPDARGRDHVEEAAQRGEDLVGGDHLVAAPAVFGVAGHLFDEPHLVPVVERESEQRTASSSLTPRRSTVWFITGKPPSTSPWKKAR